MAAALSTNANTLLDLLLQSGEAKLLFPWLSQCAQIFSHQRWARRLLEEKNDIALVDVLNPQERNGYYKKLIAHELRNITERLFDEAYTPIPKDLAEAILSALRAQPYHMDAPMYYRLGFYLPGNVLPLLNKYAPEEKDEHQLRFFTQNIRAAARALEYKMQVRPD
jgi:hypothetical protein